MNKESSGPTNPMLYDPIPEGSVQTSKKMQFVAAVAGKITTKKDLMCSKNFPTASDQQIFFR